MGLDVKVARVNDRSFQILTSPSGIGGAIPSASPLTTKGDIWGYSTLDARIAVGLNGYVLTANSSATLGVDWEPAPGGGGGGTSGLPMLEAHTASASATLDFTSFISSTYDDYMIELIQVIPATNDVQFIMRMGTGAGPTWDSGANYGWNVFITRAGGSATNGAEGGATAIGLSYGAGGTLGLSNSTNWGYNGTMRLFAPQSAIYKRVVFDASHLDAEPFRIRCIGKGSYEVSTAATGVRFLFSSGNIASGIIRIYGIPKT